MVFSSTVFLCLFLPIVLALYNIAKNITYKNTVLVLASLLFYAWGEPIWVLALLFSAVTDYFHGRVIDKYYGTVRAKIALISSCVINLGLLALFKYAGFFTEMINGIFFTHLSAPAFGLPLGISFYTFQTLSYTIDMYRGKAKVQRSFLQFMVYVSMFPQLVAGPIVRYTDIAPSLSNRNVTIDRFAYGARRFVIGLSKKVILANNAGSAASMLLDGSLEKMSTCSAWLGIAFYTFQIYFDFSGYSDMAIGLGAMLGFTFRENFDYPYISKNISEFWRRWHISLSSFFRDYVYIPLGGNRWHPIRNLFIVWGLTGLWHGASWNFILWGLFYGILLFLEKYTLKGILKDLPPIICNLYTMFFVMLGWGLFYYTDANSLILFFRALFGANASYDLTTLSSLFSNLWLILICMLAGTPIPKTVYDYLCKKSVKFAMISEPILLIIGMGVCMVLLAGQSYNPFLYFRF